MYDNSLIFLCLRRLGIRWLRIRCQTWVNQYDLIFIMIEICLSIRQCKYFLSKQCIKGYSFPSIGTSNIYWVQKEDTFSSPSSSFYQYQLLFSYYNTTLPTNKENNCPTASIVLVIFPHELFLKFFLDQSVFSQKCCHG